ncbi:Deoxyribodipyrimidine photo-lyase like protein [Verticillium longisporum]|uniref:Deoxyribodipyrimidine photo-lyase like protein n=1 Tax=Verticillium longisporum TaxID=100787 RepID=A0A8I2ZL42_VERLO|nr:Deoxyribodipyrimidine photo-lyase like protein [Verticillium longisporum]
MTYKTSRVRSRIAPAGSPSSAARLAHACFNTFLTCSPLRPPASARLRRENHQQIKRCTAGLATHFVAMPPKRGAKRQLSASAVTSVAQPASKKAKDPLREPHPFYKDAEEHGIVLRKYYPHEMSNDRARAYNNNELPRPIEELTSALADTSTARKGVKVGAAVVHWFKMDLRLSDNTSLRLASERAKDAGVPLIAMYIISPQDFEAHLTAPIRVDFMLRTLEILKHDLAKLDIPLHIETVDKRRQISDRIVELMGEWGATHLFANMEYEVDELRREAKLVRTFADKGMSFEAYAVYTPWYRSWMRHCKERFGNLFASEIPEEVPNKTLGAEEKKRFRALFPAGEHAARERLDKFCDSSISSYADRRNIPGDNGTSSLSMHLASGTISSRTCVRTARDRNKTKKLDGGNGGIQTWISEVAWRDFYKHVLVHWPYVCMNKPFKPEYANIEWSYEKDDFKAWCEGKTGFPIVDAAMRQMIHVGWMHNRCRMIVASFLCKDLLIDWRMGERFFMEHLVDGDFASNNGGWGFSASVGVDPQPYFRIFNPLLQSEKFDPDGEYIRKWVPELAGVKGKAIHDPYGRGAGPQVKKKGYPEPIVAHKDVRERALTEYKRGLGREDL